MAQLTKSQAKLLAEAGACPDEAMAAPEGAQLAVASLVREGLLVVMPDESGPTRLKITPEGRANLTTTSREPAPVTANKATNATTKCRARGRAAEAPPLGKIEALVALLQRPEGASLQAMISATGWQAHSVRGALSGAIKKVRGLPLASEIVGGVRVYRITGAQG
jgi:hypothetical protein